jgi:hypothetical protein
MGYNTATGRMQKSKLNIKAFILRYVFAIGAQRQLALAQTLSN